MSTGMRGRRSLLIIMVGLSVPVVALLVLHTTSPNLVVDTTSLGLLALLIFIWLVPFMRSITLPGGTKLELKDIEPAKQAVEEVKPDFVLVNESHRVGAAGLSSEATWKIALLSDVNVGLAGLRLEIERRLVEILDALKLENRTRFRGIAQMLDMLGSRELLSSLEANAVRQVVDVCNRAVHAEEVSAEAAQTTAALGDFVLRILDEKLRKARSEPTK